MTPHALPNPNEIRADVVTESVIEDRQPTAAILVIGDEILSGRTQEGNAHFLAGVLTEIGVALRQIRCIPDDKDTIIAAVRELSAQMDYVFTSGGIGPTHDDITADAVAAAFGARIGVRDDAKRILLDYYGPENLNEARLRMARIPDGAELIRNPVSHAPGFILRNVHVMAGVPKIFQAMVEGLRGALAGGKPTLSHSFQAYIVEGAVAAPLREIDARHPDVSFGVYPYYRLEGGPGCTIVARSTHPADLAAAAQDVKALLDDLDVRVVIETKPR